MTDEMSRRSVLGVASAAFGTGSVSNLLLQNSEAAQREATGWITRGSPSDVSGQRGVVETFRYSGSSLCNDGSVYRCRTCAGVEFYLLVPANVPQPTVDSTYRFDPTDETNVCGNFQVDLLEAEPCETAASATPTETTTATDTTTEEPTFEEPNIEEPTTDTTTEETPTDTTTETTTDTTTRTPTEEPTTEETPAEEPATEESAAEESARSED